VILGFLNLYQNVLMKRFFDLTFAFIATLFLTIPLCLLALLVKLTSRGPILYWSKRIGRHEFIFEMPKFRTMRIDTPEVATHLLTVPANWLTPVGDFLRKSSLDELPQLWCIIKGDMRADLISLRTEKGIHHLLPGLTGWAQVNGRDELPISKKVELDFEYLQRRSFLFDLKILWMTALKVLVRDGVSH